MQAVFDRPVIADSGGQRAPVQRCGCQEVSDIERCFAAPASVNLVNAGDGFHRDNLC